MTPRPMTRRQVLQGGALLAASSLLPGRALASLAAARAPRATQRVVLVVFGGGVRTRETLRSDNVPNLQRIAEQGVVFHHTNARNNGHYGSSVSVLTGSWEVFGIRENARPAQPTVFELVRKATGLPASEVWLATSGSEQETNYAYSSDKDHGSRYGANLIGGEGVFNAEFKQLVTGSGRIGHPDPAEEATLAGLRAAIRTPLSTLDDGGLGNDPLAAARIEAYILDELRGGTAAITGLGANDAKALHVARNLLSIFRPRLLGITLRDPDVAHGSFNDYVTVIRRNDEGLGAIFDALQADEELAGSTALFVLPEFGRDRDFNARRGLDHGDGSEDLREVALVAFGPDFKRGRVDDLAIQSIDVTPTIVSLLGGRMGPRTGTPIPGLSA